MDRRVILSLGMFVPGNYIVLLIYRQTCDNRRYKVLSSSPSKTIHTTNRMHRRKGLGNVFFSVPFYCSTKIINTITERWPTDQSLVAVQISSLSWDRTIPFKLTDGVVNEPTDLLGLTLTATWQTLIILGIGFIYYPHLATYQNAV